MQMCSKNAIIPIKAEALQNHACILLHKKMKTCCLNFWKIGEYVFVVKKPLITKLRGEKVKKSFFSGLFLSPSAYCLVNQLTCCQRSHCECALAEGQSDPPACLPQRGKWRPWYAISGRNVQTVWLQRQAWLAVALLKLCRRNYLFGPLPEGLVLQGLVVIHLFIHLHLVHTGTFKYSLTSTSTGSDNILLWTTQVHGIKAFSRV